MAGWEPAAHGVPRLPGARRQSRTALREPLAVTRCGRQPDSRV